MTSTIGADPGTDPWAGIVGQDRAVAELHRAGVLTSTTLMARAAASSGTTAPLVLVCGDDDFTVKQRAPRRVVPRAIPQHL